MAYTEGLKNYFWGKNPKINDTFFVLFTKPVTLAKLAIETGHPLQRNDYLRHGQVDVSLSAIMTDVTQPVACQCKDYVTLGKFQEGRFEQTKLDSIINFPVKCLRILITKSQEEWIIIHQIAVSVKKNIKTHKKHLK